MSILSDIADTIGELKKATGSMSRTAGSVMDAKGDLGHGEQRFFDRPMNSLARAAKKSVLFFPVVASESLSPETVGMLTKLVQVRAGEYMRLFVSNMDALDADAVGKGAVMSALRGATLKDAAYTESASVIATYVGRHAAELSEQAGVSPVELLARPLDWRALQEADENAKRKARPRFDHSSIDMSEGDTVDARDDALERLANVQGQVDRHIADRNSALAQLAAVQAELNAARDEANRLKQDAGTVETALRMEMNRRDAAAKESRKAAMADLAAQSRNYTAERLAQMEADLARKIDAAAEAERATFAAADADRRKQIDIMNTEVSMANLKAQRLEAEAQRVRDEIANARTSAYSAGQSDSRTAAQARVNAAQASAAQARADAQARVNAAYAAAQASAAKSKTFAQQQVDAANQRAAGVQDAARQQVKDAQTAASKAVTDAAATHAKKAQDAIDAHKAEEDKKLAAAIKFANGGETRRASRLVAELVQAGDPAMLSRIKDVPSLAGIVTMLDKLGSQVDAIETIDNIGSTVKADWRATDYDKLNQAIPLTMELTLQYRVGEQLHRTPLTLAVKGVAHIIPSLDVVSGIGSALQRDSLILQTLRLTTGEISFVKDFVLNIDVAKTRASSKTTGGIKMLETLRRQSEWNNRRANAFVSLMAERGFVPPTTTIAITADEVSRIREIYGVDFSRPATARDLMRSHNLMGFMIVDEAIGLARVFEDGDDDFDRVPFSEVKARGKEASVKDMMTVLARR